MTDTTTAETGVDPLLVQSATRLFEQRCSFEVVQQAETDGWSADVWDAVTAAGFPWVSIAEEDGGSGGTIEDVCAILRIAGRVAAPVPLAETAMLGGWLLGSAGLTLPDGPVTVAPERPDDDLAVTATATGVTLRGTLHRVPWAERADVLALLVEVDGRPTVVAVPRSAYEVEPMRNMAGEPRDTVVLDGAEAGEHSPAPAGVDGAALRRRGALSRVMLMAGALEAMSELTVGYTAERQQFGRPVGRFQAVQQHLVWGAQDAALVAMAAQVAAREATRGEAVFEIAAAKVLADQNAATATRWAHQAHGAMGMTQEYALHHLSRRLWSWRKEYSRPGEWQRVVGATVAAAGADSLYPLIAGGSRAPV